MNISLERENYPLSPQQKYIWSLSGNKNHFIARSVFVIDQSITIETIQGAVFELMKRHSILSAKLINIPTLKMPLQTYSTPPLGEEDGKEGIAIVNPPISDNESVNYLETETIGEGTKWELFVDDQEKHRLVLSIPSYFVDAYSLAQIGHELNELLHQPYKSSSVEIVEDTIQYPQYVEWRNDVLENDDRTQAIIMENCLSENKGYGEIPTRDKGCSTFELGRMSLLMPHEVQDKATSLAIKLNTSLSNLVLSCWATMLYTLSDQNKHLLIGNVCSGRDIEEIKQSIGLYAQTMPIPLHFREEYVLQDLIMQIAHLSENNMYHYEIYNPYNLIKSTDRLIKIPYQFEWVTIPTSGKQQKIYIEDVISIADLFELKLVCIETLQGVTLEVQYNKALFQSEYVNFILRDLVSTIKELENNVDVPLNDIYTISDVYYEFINQINNTSKAYPLDISVNKLFENLVEQKSDSIAIKDGEYEITYQELNQKANQIAHHLIKSGLLPGELVGVHMKRSKEMIAAVLGIIKTGAAYLPIDTTYPIKRVEQILTSALPKFVITNLADYSSYESKAVVFNNWKGYDEESSLNLDQDIQPQDSVYVIYTSGSTGVPKGVDITHRGLVNYLSWCSEKYISKEDTGEVALFTSISFDLTVTSIFVPLVTGLTLDIHNQDLLSLSNMLQSKHHVLMKLTPAHMSLFNNEVNGGSFSTRRLIVGGENLLTHQVNMWGKHSPGTIIINEYGPTETVVGCATYECSAEVNNFDSVPIGRPIANMKIFILDNNLKMTPIGVTGEICIGGVGLAKGYLNQPELTNSKFVKHPLVNGEEDERLYRTGDLGRYLPDGNIEYLGRIDSQVKVRGFRIELGEIENALYQFPGVKESVVIVKEEDNADKHLVAFIVPTDEQLNNQMLTEHLMTILPDYMLPNRILSVNELPLTTNGKIDRESLNRMAENMTASEHEETRQPKNQFEELLVSMWAQLLNRDKVGVNDNFFSLGGHSLLATQLMSRIRTTFGVELALKYLFDSPTVAELAEAVQKGIQGEETNAPIVAVSRDEKLQLSYAQQRLWILDQLDPGSASYNIPAAVKLSGRLDVEALEKSLGTIIERHESLRTTFVTDEGGQPFQIIQPYETFRLPVSELNEKDQTEHENLTRGIINAEVLHSFNLVKGPLFRCHLVRVNEEEYVLIVNMHHSISDGWSIGVLIREMTELYDAYTQDRVSELQDLPIQYADFAQWQRQWLAGKVLTTQTSYWQQELEGLTVLNIPTDYPRPAIQTHRGATHTWELDSETVEKLRVLSQQEGVTMFMMLLAAFQALLSRYSGQSDIAVGTPVANRNREETEGLIGFFVNTLVLRTEVNGDLSFLELLRSVREKTLNAYSYQDVPFELLVELLEPERDLSYSPLFQVMFALQNMPQEQIRFKDVTISPFDEATTATSKFDINVSLQEINKGLAGAIEYNPDLFSEETIGRMFEHYRTLLKAIASNALLKVKELPILTEKEKNQLHDWNRTETMLPSDDCMHTIVEAQAKNRPNAVAVEFKGDCLTYQELNQWANQIAQRLILKGVGQHDLVAIMLNRSPFMLASILAIWKTGAAYIPIDTSGPEAKVTTIMTESDAKLIITENSYISSDFQNEFKDKLYLIDEVETLAIRNEQVQDLEGSTDIKQLAYVIYTSGSTGTPKGAMIEQVGMMNHIYAKIEALNIDVSSKVAQNASHCFDISVWQFFVPLVVGGTTVIYPDELILEPSDFVQTVANDHITVLEVVPSYLASILNFDIPCDLSALKYIMVTGEQLHASLVDQWFSKFPHVPMINAYGPTEASDDITHYIMSSAPRIRNIPIGKPLSNFKIYITDPWMNLCPIGVYGELCVSGVGVGRGYLNDKEKTRKSFITDPFCSDGTQRMYKTGDLARYLPDGNIEYLGRVDHQVKIRGFRIELGEVETALLELEGVREVVTVAYEADVPGQKRLIAYVAGKQEELTVRNLRDHLKAKLPEYMIPSMFVVLSKLPLNANGKVDRHALPEPDMSMTDERYTAPQSATEEMLAGIWSDILSISQVGRNDNFFERGGHSLLATQLMSRIRHVFGVDIPLRQLFERPTVVQLAEEVNRVKGLRGEHESVIQSYSREGKLVLSYAQQRLWFLDQLEPGSAAYNMPIAVRLTGPLNVKALEESFTAITVRHEALRTTFHQVDGEPVQCIKSVQEFELPYVHVTVESVSEREAKALTLAEQEALKPFDLTQGPLIRGQLLQLGNEDHVLLVTMHHIVSDGWSMGILTRELITLYEAKKQGKEADLPELPIQYADFAAWQREWLQGEVLEQQVEYWKKQLKGPLPILNLPLDHPRPSIQTYAGATESLVLSREFTDSLKLWSQKQGVTLFMAIQAAFQILLHRYTGQKDIVIGTDVANRNRMETEGLIGFFVNQLVLRTQIDPNQKCNEFLDRIRQTTIDAYVHQDLPFNRLVEILNPSRELSLTPLFQAKLVLQNAPIQMEKYSQSFSELKTFGDGSTSARFELLLNLEEKDGQIEGNMIYNASLFSPETIRLMNRRFELLLSTMIENDSQTIAFIINEANQQELVMAQSQRNKWKEMKQNKIKNLKGGNIDEMD